MVSAEKERRLDGWQPFCDLLWFDIHSGCSSQPPSLDSQLARTFQQPNNAEPDRTPLHNSKHRNHIGDYDFFNPNLLAIANQLLANFHSSLHRSRIDIVIMTPLNIPPFLSIAHSSNCMYTDTHGKHSNKSNDLRTQKRIVCATRWPSRVPRVENKRRFPQTESTQYPESSLHSLISTSTSAEQWYSLLRISRREYSGSNGSSAISLPSLVSDPYIQTTSLHYRASIQSSQQKQLFQRSFERIARRSLQIVKPQDVLNPHRFQLHSIESSATYLENHAAQIASLDFGNGVFRKSEKRVFRKQSKALRLNDLRTLPSLHFHDPLVPIAATHVTSKRA